MPTQSSTSSDAIIALTQAWLEKAVIGLNLCPFAKAVHAKKQIRYVVSTAKNIDVLLDDLEKELRLLQAADPAEIDTTLLISPNLLHDFLDYNDFLDLADGVLVDELELEGELQIASFHPQYQFADAEPDDIENYTNRSPYPTLHLLRESSIASAVDAFPDTEAIFEKNMETLRELGLEGWEKLQLATPTQK